MRDRSKRTILFKKEKEKEKVKAHVWNKESKWGDGREQITIATVQRGA